MDDIVCNLLKREEVKKEILSNYDYMNWLKSYVNKNINFDTDDIKKDDISEEDKENINKLGLLFDIVDKYAYDNYLEFYSTDFGEFYNIKYNSEVYKIGYHGGQGIIYYVSKNFMPEDPEDSINFEDIKNNRVSSRTTQIKKEFEKLRKELIKLKELDVSKRYIYNYIQDLVEKDKRRTLSK